MAQWKLPNKKIKSKIVKVFINKYEQLQISFKTVSDLENALGYFSINRMNLLVKDFRLDTKSIYLEKEIHPTKYGYEVHQAFKEMLGDKNVAK